MKKSFINQLILLAEAGIKNPATRDAGMEVGELVFPLLAGEGNPWAGGSHDDDADDLTVKELSSRIGEIDNHIGKVADYVKKLNEIV